MATERIHCNQCKRKTRHEVLYRAIDTEMSQDEPIDFKVKRKFELLRCAGCKDAVLRRTIDFGVLEKPTVHYFPPSSCRQPPSWPYWSLPNKLLQLLLEIYASLDADGSILPMLGARTVIDLVMTEKVGDVGTFGEKLRRLEGLGVISSQNREVLNAALDIGSAAAHRGHSPDSHDVSGVLDIMEHLLHAIYVLPKTAKILKDSTPPRLGKTARTTPISKLTH